MKLNRVRAIVRRRVRYRITRGGALFVLALVLTAPISALAQTSAPGAMDSGSVQRRRRIGKRLKWAGLLVLVVVLLIVAFGVGAATLIRSMFKSEPISPMSA